MNAETKVDEAEAWRSRLIAFYEHESPWMIQKIKNLRYGDPLSIDDRNVIAGLIAAQRIAA